jgi:uncharacterized membrane protein SpoIIM required for sporulation
MLLFFNGVSIGAALGVFAGYDALHMILAFVAPHGALELSAICIAGGAGLLVGSWWLLPGARTRREALIERGRRSIVLVAGATVLLGVAAIIEGFISPLNLSLPLAYTISGTTALGALIYILSGRAPLDPGSVPVLDDPTSHTLPR